MTPSRLSVVLPVRDGMPYLRAALRSLLDQTYADYRLVVVDDFSSDGSYEFLLSLSDPRLRVVRPTSALSLPLIHRFGVGLTDTEFVALMGHDDIALPDRLRLQVALLDSDPRTAVVGCWVTMIDRGGRRVGAVRYAVTPAEISAGLIRNNQIVAPTMLFRREVYDLAGGFTDECGFAFDYDFVCRASRVAGCANVPQELLLYRYNPLGASVRNAAVVQRGALRARWRDLRRGGRPVTDHLWLLKPLLALALPPPLLARVVVPYMRYVHGRREPPNPRAAAPSAWQERRP